MNRASFLWPLTSFGLDWALFRTINVDQRGGKTESERFQRLVAMTIWTGNVDQRLWCWTRPRSNPRLVRGQRNEAQNCHSWLKLPKAPPAESTITNTNWAQVANSKDCFYSWGDVFVVVYDCLLAVSLINSNSYIIHFELYIYTLYVGKRTIFSSQVRYG